MLQNRLADVELFSPFFVSSPNCQWFSPPPQVIFSLHHDGQCFFLVFVPFFWSLLSEQNGDDVDDHDDFVLFIFIYPFIPHYFLSHSPLTRRIRRPDKLMLSNLQTPPIYFSTHLSLLSPLMCLDPVPTYLREHDELRFITFITCKLQAALFIPFSRTLLEYFSSHSIT